MAAVDDVTTARVVVGRTATRRVRRWIGRVVTVRRCKRAQFYTFKKLKRTRTRRDATKRNAKPSAVTNEQSRSRGGVRGVRFPIICRNTRQQISYGLRRNTRRRGRIRSRRNKNDSSNRSHQCTYRYFAYGLTERSKIRRYLYSYMVRTFQDCQKRIAVSGAAFADENEKLPLDTFGANINGRAFDFTFSFLIALIDTVLEIT